MNLNDMLRKQQSRTVRKPEDRWAERERLVYELRALLPRAISAADFSKKGLRRKHDEKWQFLKYKSLKKLSNDEI